MSEVKFAFPVGGIHEGCAAWEIELNVKFYASQRCPHCVNEGKEEWKDYAGNINERTYAYLPRAAVVYYDTGYSGAYLCLDCLLEGAATLSVVAANNY